jgi:HSP20 family protein
MILLRRGRPAPARGSSLDVDVTFDLGPAFGRRRQDCFAPWRPPIEVFETADGLVVRAEIAGLAADGANVIVADDELLIRGERTVVKEGGQRVYHESRVRYGEFEASVRLPFPVDSQSTTATYTDGFLVIELPRQVAKKVAARTSSDAGTAQRGGQ